MPLDRTILRTAPEVQQWFEDTTSAILSYDWETTGLSYYHMEPIGLSLCDGKRTCYIDMYDAGEDKNGVLSQLSAHLPRYTLIAHNAKFDLKCTRKFLRIEPEQMYCTFIAAFLLNENRPSHGLKVLAMEDLNVPAIEVSRWDQVSQMGFGTPEWYQYCFNDAEWAWNLFHLYQSQLLDQGLWYLFSEIEMPFLYVLADMEINGIQVDHKELEDLKLRASNKLIELEDRMMASIDKLEFSPTKRGVFDVISSALGMYNVSEFTEFLQRQKSRLNKEGVTSIFIVESGAHEERVLATLKHISDGVVSLTKDDKGGVFVQVLSMEGARFDANKHPVQLSKKGISVTGGEVDETGIIAEFCDILVIDKDLARRLVDAGFTDLEKLHVAERTELLEVKGINEETCNRILDYLGSVEYSQRVLAKKSEKWLKRGMELAEANDFDKAKMSLQRALEIDFGNTAAMMELSKIYHAEGNVAESRRSFEKAKIMDPDVTAPWLESEVNE